MANVSLRIYNREIENLVESGQLDEAIAHCRHILNTFPKHLETYRMIGKAYLEARRYDEATDIFERLLMSVPDDFVANVGMSIIRDEQKSMDAAIWHMQRAFEVQPSNAAIQAELQRLYGRRDGVEPPKIRLTRGALAHMYVQGELYPQAISEIKGVLEEDPERQDMQVLLARAYFHAGQKGEAAEICSQLLRRYPYCFDANRVLVELLPQTEQGESVQTYRKRINELNPYSAFVTGSVFHTEEVPDAAVSLERLEWDGQPVDMGPEWGESQGIGLGETPAAGDREPDWLNTDLTSESFGASTPTDESASASEGLPVPTPSAGDDEIPEFLRAAGWGEDSGTFQEGQVSYDDSDESADDVPIEEGDLPDWVKAMAPTGADSEIPAEPEEDLTQDDVPDWLQGIGDAQSAPDEGQLLADADLPDWLEAEKPAEVEMPESQPQEEPVAEPASDDDIPDWLKSMQPDEEQSAAPQEPVQEVQQEPVAEPASDDDIPDWLKSMQPDEEQPAAPQEPVQEVYQEPVAEPASDDDIPDWLKSMQPDEEQPAAPQEPSPEIPQEPAQEAPMMSDESLSDWQIGDEGTEEGPADYDKTDTGELGTSADEQEDAIAWLEGLASKHGAKSEELVTDPNARTEVEPDWVQKAKATKDQVGAEASDSQEQPPADLPDFLTEETAEPTEEPAPEVAPPVSEEQPAVEASTDLHDFLAEEQTEPSQESTAEADTLDVSNLGTSAEEQDDAVAWLESLASKHGAKPEELVTDPAARSETEPDWVQKAKATQDQVSAEEPVSQEQPPSETSADLPDFLTEETAEPAGEPTPEAASTVSEEQAPEDAPTDLPDFLAEEQAEPSQESTAEADAVNVDDLGASAEEQDDAVAWLESLASKHGAKPEELVTDPEARKDTAPEWVQKASEATSSEYAIGERPTAPPPPEETVEDEQEGESLDAELEEALTKEPISSADTDETGMWLQELDEESEVTGEPQEPVSEAETPAVEDDVPDWLREMEGDAPQTEATQTSGGEAPLPDWLSDMDSDSPEVESARTPASEETESEPVSEPIEKIDINTASIDELAELPGIGDLLAQNIVAQREAYGAFSSIDDLSNIAGIGPSTIDELRGKVEIKSQPDITDWLRNVDVDEDAAEAATTEPASSDDLPSWLAGLDEDAEQAQPAKASDDDLPAWLRTESEDEPVQPEPTAPADWKPADAAEPAPVPDETEAKADEPVPLPDSESKSDEPVVPSTSEMQDEEQPVQSTPSPEPEPEAEQPPAQTTPPPASEPEPKPEPKQEPAEPPPGRPAYQEPVTRSRTGMTGMLSPAQDPALTEAQNELTRGNIPAAMENYSKLIKKGKMLEEIIFDLREALYRYPVEVIILQTLGDAYMRANRLQEALDSYTKAEELLR